MIVPMCIYLRAYACVIMHIYIYMYMYKPGLSYAYHMTAAVRSICPSTMDHETTWDTSVEHSRPKVRKEPKPKSGVGSQQGNLDSNGP